MAQQRTRFFHHAKSDGGSTSCHELSRPQSSFHSPPSSGNGGGNAFRLLPGRSLSTNAALLRQRLSATYSPSSSSSSSFQEKVWKASTITASSSSNTDMDVGLPQYTACGGSSLPSSSTASHYSDIDGSANYHLNVSCHHGQPYRASNNDGWLKPLLCIFALVGLSIFAVQSHQSTQLLRHSIQVRNLEIVERRESMHQLEHRIQRLRSETYNLESQVEELEDAPNLKQPEMQRKLFHLEHNKLLLEQSIQANSRRLLQEKFGHGPHYYVEMTVEFDPLSNVYEDHHNTGETMVIETAHLDDMPHSIHLFLEQVDHGLFDNTVFHRNAEHVLQAGPTAGTTRSATQSQEEHYANFAQQYPSLMHVLFQEYSPDMPHQQYALGYPGRPGGPDFYISLTAPNNDSEHRRMEEEEIQQQQLNEMDPCFARVVQGTKVVDRIQQSQTKPGWWQDGLIHPVVITSMKVVSSKEYQQ